LTQIKNVLHVQSTQTSRVHNLSFFQTFLLKTKCTPFVLKIGKILTLNIKKVKGLEIMILIINLNTFGSNMFFTLKFMDFENVVLVTIVHIYVIEGMNA
jgi:hypothetical protein